GVPDCRRLKRLQLRKYKPPSRNLAELAQVQSLESLQLIQSPICSLQGIERLQRLWEFEAHYCSRLRDLHALAGIKTSLQRLRLDHCKAIEHPECVHELSGLTHLALCDDRPLQSIGFVRQMPRLAFFAFVGTPVIDGDMTPLFGLNYAGFDNKRHYSHSFDQVQKIIADRGVAPLGPWVWGTKSPRTVMRSDNGG
ncbi:MAG: hypothetical protein ABSH20_07630, partial [Tepidisphaeraceae bacterium]